MFSSQTVKTLERFDPATASRKRCWLIIGGRNTGKSVLLKDLLIKTNRGDEMIVAMTATVSTANMLRQMLPEGFVLDEGYDHVKADQFLAMGRKLVRMGKQKNLTLVTDDIMYDKSFMQSETQSQLALNGRHYNFTTFNTTQYSMLIPPNIRSNMDYIFVLKETNRSNRKKLFEHYFGIFKTFQEFDEVFQHYTKNYGALVLDRTQSSGLTKHQVLHYRADASMRPVHIGKESYFRMFHKMKFIDSLKQTDRDSEQACTSENSLAAPSCSMTSDHPGQG